MFVKSQLYPKRYAFFLQFLLIFCSCCGTALAGRSWRRHGLTLNIFCQPSALVSLLSIPVSPPWSEEMARSRAGDRSSQTPPPSTRSGVRAAFSASFGGPYPSLINDDDVSVKRNGNIFFFLLFFVSWFAVFVARRSLVCAGTWSEDAQREQPEAHRREEEDGCCWIEKKGPLNCWHHMWAKKKRQHFRWHTVTNQKRGKLHENDLKTTI